MLNLHIAWCAGWHGTPQREAKKMRCLSQRVSNSNDVIYINIWVLLKIWVFNASQSHHNHFIGKRVFKRASQHWYPIAMIPATSQHQALPAISASDLGTVPGTVGSDFSWISCSSRTHGLPLEYRVTALTQWSGILKQSETCSEFDYVSEVYATIIWLVGW